MTSTIEVPISLIKAGDMDAIRELLPNPSLFGRWATHPNFGRGIIFSAYPDDAGLVGFSFEKENIFGGAEWTMVSPDTLTLDQVELTTTEDFENAPEGTIVAAPYGNAYQKVYAYHWESLNEDVLTDKGMAASGPWPILRWGWGDQQ